MVGTWMTGYKRSSRCSRNLVALFKPPAPLPHDKLVSGRGNAGEGWIQGQAKDFHGTEPRLGVEGSVHLELTKLFVRQLADISDLPLAQYIEGVHAGVNWWYLDYRDRSVFCSLITD
jgi:hypothetical protein